VYLKKKKDKKGFLITKKDGVIIDIETLYPTQASSRFFDKEKELKRKNNRSWHFLDADQYKNIVAFEKSFQQFGQFQQDTFVNRMKQWIL